MGKGDKKSKKGKRNIGSYGNSRRKKVLKAKANKTSKPKEQ
ncbi:MAG: 30S ribosomal protein THX [Cytophagaceae bacterium]|nr:30S ribosomal protein THX [Cytophagaceae bacterium]MDW8457256.1 30S ribosomal protein THX [Cytophagaceae bacterium]